jgi:dihydroorotase
VPVRSRHREPAGTLGRRAELVLSGRAWIQHRIQPVEVGIDAQGRISAVARTVPGGRRKDLNEALILPSAIDLHAHFREPGPPGAGEDFATGTLQAALGGVGVAVDMPNTLPPTTDPEALATKDARARRRLAVDVVLLAGLTSPARVPALSRTAGGFKLYLSPTTGIEPPAPGVSLRELLSAVEETGLLVSVHAEDPGRFVSARPPESVAAWDAYRPAGAERAAVERVLAAAPPGLRLHIAHVTDPGIADRLVELGQSFEATPHHLLEPVRPGLDARWKVNPPLRPSSAQTGLWERFRAGRIPCLASDHAPHPLAEKQRPFPEAPSGMPGIETMIPLLLARVRAGELSLDTLLRASADRPARILGLPLGRLVPGHRAHLMVVDFRRLVTVRSDRLHAPCGWSAFEGREAIFPIEHYFDGRAIVSEGEYMGDREGRVLRPEYARSPAARAAAAATVDA